MIKVYNGDAYAVQESEYDRSVALRFFLDGHRDEYVLIYRDEQPLKALSYYDVLYNRKIPENAMVLSQDIFKEAGNLFFSYDSKDRWHRTVAVCGDSEDVECILYYEQNHTNYNYAVSEFEGYSLDMEMDLELLSRADTYIFDECEEYTVFICCVLERYFPEKKKIFLDENISLFPCLHFQYCIEAETTPQTNCGHVFRITSNREKDFIGGRRKKNTYSSLDIMTSLFWRNTERRLGSLNPDRKFLWIRFPIYSSGLGDVIRFCMTKVAMLEYRALDYIPVIDLSVPDDGNSFSGGRQENVWEDFFEPLNGYRPEEVLQSQHVLLLHDKLDAFNPYITEQYYNPEHMRKACKKYLRPNKEMLSYIDTIRKQFFRIDGARFLGVVARGTDYRYGGFDLPVPMEDEAYIRLVKQKMGEWDCSHLLLATEDSDILKHFQQAGFGDKMTYIDQKRFQYTDVDKPGLLIAKMKKPDNDYHDEMPYLAVLYLLAECKSLISNCRCGAFEVADFINGNAYEHRYCCGEDLG